MLTRITFAGSIYLAIVCVIPELLIYKLNVPFYFGGTSLLIVIGVGLDTAQQIESHMLMRNYEGFLGKGMAPLRGTERVTGTSMRVVFLGAPGVGKGTQADRIAAQYQVAKISTGDLLREAVRNQTTSGS